MGLRKRGLILALGIALVGCGENDPGRAKSMKLTRAQKNAIAERIKPFSVVNVAGQGILEVGMEEALPGEAKYIACASCHGGNGGGGVGPALAGQTVKYLVGRLTQYKNKETVGSQSNMMWAQAAGLSNTDMEQLAEYIVSL